MNNSCPGVIDFLKVIIDFNGLVWCSWDTTFLPMRKDNARCHFLVRGRAAAVFGSLLGITLDRFITDFGGSKSGSLAVRFGFLIANACSAFLINRLLRQFQLSSTDALPI